MPHHATNPNEPINRDRRRFLGTAALAMVAWCGAAYANQRLPREFAAIGRATSWLNSPPLTAARQFGEGQYDKSEATIQRLLADAGIAAPRGGSIAAVEGRGIEAAADWRHLRSPENYLGYERTVGFVSSGGVQRNRPRTYSAPTRMALNEWALSGEWLMRETGVTSISAGARIAYRFHSRDLHLVMGPPRGASPLRFRVSLDGQPPAAWHGVDVVANGNGVASEQRLHQLIRQAAAIVDRRFEIEFLDAGVETLAFTFG